MQKILFFKNTLTDDVTANPSSYLYLSFLLLIPSYHGVSSELCMWKWHDLKQVICVNSYISIYYEKI